MTLLLFLVIILTPLFGILLRAFDTPGSSWELINEYYLTRYISNSLLLVVGVAISCLILGVFPAWLVANYNFPGRRLFRLGLLLPLSIPSYIMAYTYTGIFDSTGTVQQLATSWFGQEAASEVYFNFMTPFWLMVLLGFCLYPYVYSACLISFSGDSVRQLEASATLGASGWKRLFKVGLPMARPAILAGLFLVIMEVLNEYGAVQYFNFKTFTTGIFSAWENNDLTSAIRVAFMLFGIALLFLLVTKWLKGRQQITSSTRKPITRKELKPLHKLLATGACTLLFLFAFLVPFAQLIYWTYQSADDVIHADFLAMAWNTFVVSIVAAVIITVVAFILLYAGKQTKAVHGQKLASLGILGYSVPGAIIAVGIIIPFVFLDDLAGTDLFLGTVTGLIIAYMIRFMAVSYGPLKGAFEKQGLRLDEASGMLRTRPIRSLFKVHFPILRPALFMAVILVFVDVMKELPITLILSPMNYDTLATEAYRYAQINESAVQAAPASILLILIGIIPILLLSKMLRR